MSWALSRAGRPAGACVCARVAMDLWCMAYGMSSMTCTEHEQYMLERLAGNSTAAGRADGTACSTRHGNIGDLMTHGNARAGKKKEEARSPGTRDVRGLAETSLPSLPPAPFALAHGRARAHGIHGSPIRPRQRALPDEAKLPGSVESTSLSGLPVGPGVAAAAASWPPPSGSVAPHTLALLGASVELRWPAAGQKAAGRHRASEKGAHVDVEQAARCGQVRLGQA